MSIKNTPQEIENVRYIVGDGFSGFAQQDRVCTFSQIIQIIATSLFDLKKMTFVIGQGLSEEERRLLKAYSKEGKLGSIVNGYQRLASDKLTHKKKYENIMITDPLVVEPGKVYRSYLCTDDACAEMSDHITGQHIQGMVLTEAARQMMLAVAEKYILKREEQGCSYCILNSVNSTYHQFAFPVDTTIEHKIIFLKNIRLGSYIVKTKTFFIQNNIAIAEVDINYEFHTKKLLEKRENQLAEKILKSKIQEHINSQSFIAIVT